MQSRITLRKGLKEKDKLNKRKRGIGKNGGGTIKIVKEIERKKVCRDVRVVWGGGGGDQGAI